MKLIHAIPALPASDMERTAAFYRDKLGFTVVFQDDGFTKLLRDPDGNLLTFFERLQPSPTHPASRDRDR